MLKRLIQIIFASTILFCVVSFLSVFTILLLRSGTDQPTANIGFPLKYYEQFWVDKNDLHHGWNFRNFIIDFIVALIVVYVINVIRNKKRNQV